MRIYFTGSESSFMLCSAPNKVPKYKKYAINNMHPDSTASANSTADLSASAHAPCTLSCSSDYSVRRMLGHASFIKITKALQENPPIIDSLDEKHFCLDRIVQCLHLSIGIIILDFTQEFMGA